MLLSSTRTFPNKQLVNFVKRPPHLDKGVEKDVFFPDSIPASSPYPQPSSLTTREYVTHRGTVPTATTDGAAPHRQALAADLFCHNKLAKVEPCLVLADVLFPRTVPWPGDPFVLPSGYIRDGYILRAELEINLTLSIQGYILSQLLRS